MAVERRDPVPAGRYWIWLNPGEDAAWETWTRQNAPKVRVRLSEGSDGGTHVVFDVLEPVKWIGFGFPTIVESGTLPTTSETVQAPAPPPPLVDRIDSALTGFRNLVLVGGGIWLISKILSVRSR